MPSIINRAAIVTASAVGLYAILLGALMTPRLQRLYCLPAAYSLPVLIFDSAIYANAFHTLFYHDLSNTEQFGFCRGQVTPFTIQTSDGETLYAWHVLPLETYTRHEGDLRHGSNSPAVSATSFRDSIAHRLLRGEQRKKVVISFHGNAGHVAQGWRPDTFRYLSNVPGLHVFTIDYRGFGYSSGSPTEAGLIKDGVALVNHVVNDLAVLPEDIVILGQSLGTAVASAVALEFADPKNRLNPGKLENRDEQPLASLTERSPTLFAGLVLVAPFSSLPSLMLTYRIGGILPLLLPLRPFPAIASMLTSRMADTWPTAERLRHYYKAASPESGSGMGFVQLVHAVNDRDISYHQTEMICREVLGDTVQCASETGRAVVLEADKSGMPRFRFEIVEYGGHNRIATHSPVSAAVIRAFEVRDKDLPSFE